MDTAYSSVGNAFFLSFLKDFGMLFKKYNINVFFSQKYQNVFYVLELMCVQYHLIVDFKHTFIENNSTYIYK